MKSSVITFPGSNCDRDMDVALKKFGFKNKMVWHDDVELPKSDLVVLPGGFSYGDYLRCGSMASKSKIMKSVLNFAQGGGKVMGVCNGFQILVESGLLPGVLLRNKYLEFICKNVFVKINDKKNIYFKNIDNEVLEFQEISKPTISSKQILIKTKAASYNPLDYKIIRGDFKSVRKIDFPKGIGRDVSGIVEDIGPDVEDFKIGDNVFSRISEEYVGTMAEYVVSNESDVCLMPSNLNFLESASIPLAGLTVYQSLARKNNKNKNKQPNLKLTKKN